MTLLDSLRGPADLKNLGPDELTALAAEIRDRLISTVSANSGHLGPNLGVVELTIALHRVFNSPRDPLIFDTGHQSYVHKLLTGRQQEFATLRKPGGMSGYPCRAESPHDQVENSHASTSLSYADGLAKAFRLRSEDDRTVVAVIGDGALTGGMAWEALNNIAAAGTNRVVIVVNDNGRSYAPTHGAIATHLAQVRTTQRYENTLARVKSAVLATPVIGAPLYEALHGLKTGLKDILQPQVLFEDLGLKYVGPVDGHDEAALELALTQARGFGAPVIVHVLTHKGHGYLPAENNTEDCLHQVAADTDPLTGAPYKAAARTWSHVFAEEMLRIGGQREDVVAITAAMLYPTGLAPFAAAYPDRVFDVGIAEQHAVTSAAGLAMGGLHPVVAIYSTFLNRAFDQMLTDVAMHRLPVTFVLDRAGVTGPDGASHHGMWDGSISQLVPGLRVAAPRDAARLAELLDEAVADGTGPTMIRYPKAPADGELPSQGRIGRMDILAQPAGGTPADVLLIGAGAMAGLCVDAASRLADQGIGALVLDPRWVKPVDPALVPAAREVRLAVTVEDNGVAGGFGDAVSRTLRGSGVHTPVISFGLPQEFLTHGTRSGVLDDAGLTAQRIARSVTEKLLDLPSGPPRPELRKITAPKKIILAEPRGFCAGVRRAIEIVERALETHGAPVYVRKQIVHNDHVVRQLEAKGAVFVESEDEIPDGAMCIFSAHGVSPQVRENAQRRLTVLDATCPLVAKVHSSARRFARDQRTVLLIGHAEHEEVEGTYGEAPEQTIIVRDAAEARRLELPAGTPVAYLSQTTLSVDETAEIVAILRERFPGLAEPAGEDVCYASTNRQNAVKAIARRSDLMLIVSSAKSSNGIRMVEVARTAGVAAELVPDADQLRPEWLAGVGTVGVSAAASTPEVLVEQVVERLGTFGFTDVETEGTVRETVVFSPPGTRTASGRE